MNPTRCFLGAMLATLVCAVHAGEVDREMVSTRQGLFDPQSTTYRSVTRNGATFSVVQTTPTMQIGVSDQGRVYRVGLVAEAVQLQSVHAGSSRLLVIAWMNGVLASVATVIDRVDGGVVDKFVGYDMTVSPNARYVAFRRIYPRMMDAPSEQYMLYDMELSPAENRASFVLRPGDVGPDTRIDVGRLLYPTKPGEIDPSAELAPHLQHRALSSFFWDAASSKLSFVDLQGGKPRLVVADLTVVGAQQMKGADLSGSLCTVAAASDGASCASLSRDFVRVDYSAGSARVSSRRSATGPEVVAKQFRWSDLGLVD